MNSDQSVNEKLSLKLPNLQSFKNATLKVGTNIVKLGQVAYPTTFLLLVLLTGLIALSLLRTGILLQTLMQIIASLTIVIVVSTRLFFPKIRAHFGANVAYLIEGVPVLLFIYLLILSTGGVASPFLVLTHFLALAIAFLLSPQLAVEFIFATVLLLGTQIYFDISAQKLLSQNLFVVILYFIAYLALVPISYAVAKEYKFKEEWANLLEKQIATSKAQEEQLLKNINEAIVVLSKNFEILYLNQTAGFLFKISQQVIGQDFYKIFSLKDKEGRNLYSYSLPFSEILSSKMPQIIENIQIQSQASKFIKVDLRIVPAITPEGPLGLILIIQDRSLKEYALKKRESTTQAALARFLSFLANQKRELEIISQYKVVAQETQSLNKQNQELGHLAQDFIYSLRLESGEIGAIWDLMDLGKVMEQLVTEEKTRAGDYEIFLDVPSLEEAKQIVQPKTNLKIPVKKRLFPESYVVGNKSWINDSISRVLELAYRISEKRSFVSLQLTRDQDLAKIEITCHKSKIAANQAYDLFEKFHGSLASLPALAQTSGLEGYIAKSLLERMGANISVESLENPKGLTLVVTFGIKT